MNKAIHKRKVEDWLKVSEAKFIIIIIESMASGRHRAGEGAESYMVIQKQRE